MLGTCLNPSLGESVDSDMIRNWMEHMIDAGNKATSVNRRLSALKMFYRFALVRHYVESDPAHSLKGPKESKPLPQFLKENEMDELLDRKMWGGDYNNVRARTIIILFYETGMRLSELIGLDVDDVNFIKKEIKITGKGNKQRIVPFGDELKNALLEYLTLRAQRVMAKSGALLLADRGRTDESGSSQRNREGEPRKGLLVEKEKSARVEAHVCYCNVESWCWN